jgi:hypothetical protein
VTLPAALVPSNDQRAVGRRHVPARLQVRHRVRGPKQPGDEFRGQVAGVSSAHVRDLGCATVNFTRSDGARACRGADKTPHRPIQQPRRSARTLFSLSVSRKQPS